MNIEVQLDNDDLIALARFQWTDTRNGLDRLITRIQRATTQPAPNPGNHDLVTVQISTTRWTAQAIAPHPWHDIPGPPDQHAVLAAYARAVNNRVLLRP